MMIGNRIVQRRPQSRCWAPQLLRWHPCAPKKRELPEVEGRVHAFLKFHFILVINHLSISFIFILKQKLGLHEIKFLTQDHT